MIFRRVFRRVFGGNEWSDARDEKDFRVRVAPDGTITAHCRHCDRAMRVEEDGQRLWFTCSSCERHAFYSLNDAQSDRNRARIEEEPVELSFYYYDELPAGVHPPRQKWGGET